MKSSVEKIANSIRKNITSILQTAVKDPKIGFITVVDCEVTNDLSYAKVYVSFLGKEARKQAGMKALERSKGFIRKQLSQKLKLRKCPELIFVLDNTLEQGDKIEKILSDLHK